MLDILIYTTPICPYCVKAKALLQHKGVEEQIREIDVSANETLRMEMMKKSGGRRTVPQIFINGQHVGGFDDLYALDREGKLDAMLNG